MTYLWTQACLVKGPQIRHSCLNSRHIISWRAKISCLIGAGGNKWTWVHIRLQLKTRNLQITIISANGIYPNSMTSLKKWLKGGSKPLLILRLYQILGSLKILSKPYRKGKVCKRPPFLASAREILQCSAFPPTLSLIPTMTGSKCHMILSSRHQCLSGIWGSLWLSKEFKSLDLNSCKRTPGQSLTILFRHNLRIPPISSPKMCPSFLPYLRTPCKMCRRSHPLW